MYNMYMFVVSFTGCGFVGSYKGYEPIKSKHHFPTSPCLRSKHQYDEYLGFLCGEAHYGLGHALLLNEYMAVSMN